MEEGESVAFASGMAGIAAVFDQLHGGSQIVLADDCYQGVAGTQRVVRFPPLIASTGICHTHKRSILRCATMPIRIA